MFRSRRLGPALVAIFFALATSSAHLVNSYAHMSILGQVLWMGPQAVWMTPLAYTLLFGLATLVLLGVLRLSGDPIPRLRVSVTFFGFVCFISLVLIYPSVHWAAALLLALGLAVETGRQAGRHPAFFRRVFRQGSALLATGLVLSTSVVLGGRQLIESRRIQDLPRARADAPNVLVIILDTVRAASLSLYGYDRPTTPNLERYAKTGTVFENAFAPANWTLPSHASLFTGRHSHELSTHTGAPLDDRYPTLAEVFTEHGYVTAGFVANLWYCTREHGLDRGFLHYEDHDANVGEIVLSTFLGRRGGPRMWMVRHHRNLLFKSAADVNEDFLDWLPSNGGRPFFAFLNYFDAHSPYLAEPPFEGRFTRPGAKLRSMHHLAGLEPAELRARKQDLDDLEGAYDESIAHLDHYIGKLLEELRRRELLRNTVVVITSDHGEQFGEHDLLEHRNSLYLQVLEVPLVISFPGRVPAGRIVSAPVSLRDVAATVLDLASIQAEGQLPGSSLVSAWAPEADTVSRSEISEVLATHPGQGDGPDWHPITRGPMQSLVAGPFHYIRNGDGREELYRYEMDLREEVNLAGKRSYATAVRALRERLTSTLGSGDGR